MELNHKVCIYIVQVLLELQHLVANGVHLQLCFAVSSFLHVYKSNQHVAMLF